MSITHSMLALLPLFMACAPADDGEADGTEQTERDRKPRPGQGGGGGGQDGPGPGGQQGGDGGGQQGDGQGGPGGGGQGGAESWTATGEVAGIIVVSDPYSSITDKCGGNASLTVQSDGFVYGTGACQQYNYTSQMVYDIEAIAYQDGTIEGDAELTYEGAVFLVPVEGEFDGDSIAVWWESSLAYWPEKGIYVDVGAVVVGEFLDDFDYDYECVLVL